MSAPDLRRASQVFDLALAAPAGERERVLMEACGADAALAEEVRSLLAHHERAEGFLAMPAPLVGIEEDLVLRALGRYRILGRLGAGGMGVVYLAEQDNPRRRVALKVLRPGASGTAGRFAHEAELLGRLQHPGIAQIHEAVAGDEARGLPPYFAMEYVEGRALDVYASEERLGLRARLGLLVELCEAVQHAHQKGVVHRDLKPANVLVDASGRPKVLDFGVARAVGNDVRAATLRTNPGEIVGTLAYMSPEQAGGDPERLDTRADVYALGVVAYELLAGRLPFELGKKSLTEAVRTIREEEPARLSRTAPEGLRRALAGDLETIVAKAMAKEPERRYASASELAQDLRRFLADEPIGARPPSALYQLRKFARRNSALVGGAAAFVALLTAAVVIVSRQALELRRERDGAVALQQEAERERESARAAETRAEEARAEAEREASAAIAVSSFLEDVLAAAEPYVADEETTVADAVRWAEEHAAERFAARPDVLANLEQRLASIHYSRGELEAARASTERALLQGQGQGEEPVEPLVQAERLTSLGTVLEAQGKTREAEAELRRALELFDAHGDPDDARRLTALTTLSAVLLVRGEHQKEALVEAEDVMREVLERRIRVHGPEHPYTLTARNNLANLLMKTGRAAEGESMLREVLASSRRVLSDRHPNTITTIFNLADALRLRGALDEAQELFEEAIELGTENLPAGHWQLGLYHSRYGELLAAEERPEEAEAELREGYELLETALGADHSRSQRAAAALAAVYRTLGDTDAADEWAAKVREEP